MVRAPAARFQGSCAARGERVGGQTARGPTPCRIPLPGTALLLSFYDPPQDRYDEVEDEKKGGNYIITAAADFSDIRHFRVGVRAESGSVVPSTAPPASTPRDQCVPFAPRRLPPQPLGPLRGFSSAKFLPGSQDRVIVALKSEENSELDRQTTYLTVYAQEASGEWRVVLDEQELPHAAKFEGLEVLSWS